MEPKRPKLYLVDPSWFGDKPTKGIPVYKVSIIGNDSRLKPIKLKKGEVLKFTPI